MSEIVILGSGLSGMISALSFANFGIKTTIIERTDLSCNNIHDHNDVRTTALNPRSQAFLDQINAWQDLYQYISPISDIYVLDNKTSPILHFPNNDSGYLGYIISNHDFKNELLNQVQKNELITIIDNTTYNEVDPYTNTLHLSNNNVIHYDLLVVCDGIYSKIKHRYFTKKINKPYNQHALTFHIEHEKDHEGSAVEHFLPSGPFAILPMLQKNKSSVVWTVKSCDAPLLVDLPKDRFEYLIQQNFGPFLGRIKLASTIAQFPLRAYVADQYYFQNIALVADSAHIVHPLAGQGLNQGINDIDCLTRLVSSEKCMISESLLRSYELDRKDDNLAMYYITDNVNRLFSNNSSILKHLRRFGLFALENCNPLKQQLIRYASGGSRK
ncbi:MAG: FAD-dependent monooxygenase [Rickettsiaceae bacterium]